jgi:hypothetical protein
MKPSEFLIQRSISTELFDSQPSVGGTNYAE